MKQVFLDAGRPAVVGVSIGHHYDHNRKEMGETMEVQTPQSAADLSSTDLWELLSSQAESDMKGTLLQEDFAGMIQQLDESYSRVATLEKEVTSVKEEKLKQEFQSRVYVKQLEDEIERLKQKAEIDLAELKIRQSQIENEVPSLEEQIKSLKDVLHDLNISEALYIELTNIPKERRTVREHILVLSYEQMSKYRQDLEALYQERDTSREALLRANDEVLKLRREIQQNAASYVVESKNKDRELEVALSRNEHLEMELQNTIVQAQILSAKGSLYDEVRGNLLELEKRLAGVEEEKRGQSKLLHDLIKEKQVLEESLKDKEHHIELLQIEKAHLNGQYKAMEDQMKTLEGEKKKQQEKVQELEEGQKSLYDRMLHQNGIEHAALDQRVHEEILQAQQRNKQEIESVRSQILEAANFEIQMLQRTRDLAMSDAEKARTMLQESRNEYELLLKRYLDQQVSMVSNSCESSLATSTSLIDKETQHALCQVKIENEVLSKKVENLIENLHKCENDRGKELEDLRVQLESANASLAQYQMQFQMLDDTLSNACEVLSICTRGSPPQARQVENPSVIQRTIDKMLLFVNKSETLQRDVKLLKNENGRLQKKMTEEQEKRAVLEQIIKNAHEPESALVKTIQQSEEKLAATLKQKKGLEDKLREAIQDKERVNCSLQKLRQDLRRLLQAQGNVESLQKILMEKDQRYGSLVLRKLSIMKDSVGSRIENV